MLDDSKKYLEVEITDLVTGLPLVLGEADVHEFDGMSQAARVESIKFNDILIMNTKITDRSHQDLKGLCQLFLDHDAEESGFQFNAVIVAYLINTALTVDQAYSFVKENMKVEAKIAEFNQHKTNMSDLITSSIGEYKYLFSPTH